jgi:hypothetical protein
MITQEMMECYLSNLHNKYNQNPQEYARQLPGGSIALLLDLNLCRLPNTWIIKGCNDYPSELLQIHEIFQLKRG